MTFKEKIYNVVAQISEGETLTYKQVAERVGRPKAYRAVGNILNKNYSLKIPCHRVVRSDGNAGGYNRGAKKKMEILNRESKNIKNSAI